MIQRIEMRVNEVADYIISTNCTIRQAAIKFGVSKSTIHMDVTERLPRINKRKYKKVKKVLDNNYEEKNSRGGKARHMNAILSNSVVNNCIKFRVWDKTSKKMYYMKDLKIIFIDNIIKVMKDDVYLPDIIIMRFTGCVDKNGKEIYEHDVLTGKEYLSCSVYNAFDNNVSNNQWCNDIKYHVADLLPSTLQLIHYHYSNICEVKGNIFENPELNIIKER